MKEKEEFHFFVNEELRKAKAPSIIYVKRLVPVGYSFELQRMKAFRTVNFIWAQSRRPAASLMTKPIWEQRKQDNSRSYSSTYCYNMQWE